MFFRMTKCFIAVIAGLAVVGGGQSSAKNLLFTADGRIVEIKGGTFQPDLSAYRSPLDSIVVNRRFILNDATYMANETFKFGMEGFDDLVRAAMPVAYKRPFQWVVAKEMYFYARYLLDYTGARSHAGIHMVHAPYWTMQAQRHTSYNTLQRDRGERVFSNKDIMLGLYLPMVYQRTGFPRVFDDVQLSYLQYKSVDPHFTGRLDNRDTFEDPMSGKVGGWGQPNTFLNDYQQRFNHDLMDTTFHLGGIGQFVKRRMQWSDYFFHSEHTGQSDVSLGTEVAMLGNDAEEGIRGWGLTMGALNAILEVKSSMFTDGEKLMGINPQTYDPAAGLRYIPHEIEPDILWVGDIPERVWSLDMKDNSSQLWDQASWIWGTTAYATTVKRRPLVFTDNPPVDGGFVEKTTSLVAESMANAIFQNVEAMHTRDGVFVSEWRPESGTGSQVALRDMMMAMIAMRDLEQSWGIINRYPEIADRARDLLDRNARFLVEVQGKDGSFYEGYSVSDGAPVGSNAVGAANWAAIRALVAAYSTSEDESYLRAARRTFNLMNSSYWVEEQGVYRSRLGDDTVIVTPYTIGITAAAMREMLLTTPTHLAEPQIERVARWWVQTVDQSGAIQAETQLTGEIYTGFISADDDGDGIPYVSQGHGRNGIAPLIAAETAINVGGSSNELFSALRGDRHNRNQFKPVRMNYIPASDSDADLLVLALNNSDGPDLIERGYMERVDGTLIPLPPSRPIKVGLGTVLGLSGQEIFEANCSQCHGQHGEGIDGMSYEDDLARTHEAMFKIVNTGRPEKFMPAWGTGNDDGFGGTLTRPEIDLVVDYIQSDEFEVLYRATQAGEAVAGAWPKDVWFYLSRENAAAGGALLSDAEDARRIYNQFEDPASVESGRAWNIPRMMPDADLQMSDRATLYRRLGWSVEDLDQLFAQDTQNPDIH